MLPALVIALLLCGPASGNPSWLAGGADAQDGGIEDQCKSASYAFCCETGTPCDCSRGTTSPGQCQQASYAFCCSVGTPCDCAQPPQEFLV
mmetsp:Transcript_67819/g.176524  ORF Transcript_67819/g.176524 Transcript_67819/m.176524 type:complete len:91 (-) Transcript_67819:86-358(-)